MNTISSSPHRRSGFSLVELIGVLAITAIMASMAVPSLITRINRANSAKESKALATFGESLENHILRTKSIPDETTWAQVTADELGIGLDNVTASIGQQPRVYFVDPAITIAGQTGVLPYTQSASGSAIVPINVRLMIVSSQFTALPTFLISGVAQSAEDFENVWDAPRGEVPSGWPAEWTGHGEDLHVERLNLTPQFQRVVMSDITDGVSAEIAVEGAPLTIPVEGLSGFYFIGTEISLMNDGVIDSREQIDGDLSFTYERGIWRGQLWEGKVKDATDLATALDSFRLSRITQEASENSSQQAVIDAYYNYILTYSVWAKAGFPAAYAANSPVDPDILAILDDHINGQGIINQIVADLEELQYPLPLYQALLDAQSQLAALTDGLMLY
ncbi:MAG: prepilin-type N-terminal cleavage/methylation domain-containing protein [Verrucomicrobiales bacterium]|jgi:prepilin-type N-terminal cleavage/methylation domain-containing protein